MKVATEEIKVGSVLLKDVLIMNDFILVPKETVLTAQHIEFLHAFSVMNVDVHMSQIYTESVLGQVEDQIVIGSIGEIYLLCVEEFKLQFINLQSGSSIDILKMRELIVPLFEKLLENKQSINDLVSLSNKEDYLYHHCVTTGLISGLIGKELKLEHAECIQLLLGGLLSDAGMSKLPISILKKESTLTHSETETLFEHPTHTYKLVQKIPSLKNEVKVAMLQHHERLDGSGYPLKVKHDKIHIYAKIIAIADVYHAMCSHRKYRKKMHYIEVIEYFLYDSFGKFDRMVVRALATITFNLKQGQIVLLSNGEEAEVKFIDSEHPTRPLIHIESTGELIYLQNQKGLFIKSVL
ncbi:MAG: HD-GYP domain-containing protein [Bacilli bacterium]